IPAFQTEEFMPPEGTVKSSVTFFYLVGPLMLRNYWESVAQERTARFSPFIGDPKKLKPLLSGIISPSDPPETQLRKLYARVQKIRYLSYEPAKTEQEVKRESLKANKNVEDVLKHDYAAANEINLVLVALARAAGFVSAPLEVKSRDAGFF